MSNSDFDPQIVSLQGETGGKIVSILSSDTTRNVYAMIEDQTATPKAIADELDMSLQNVHYHLEKIRDAGLIESDGIEYSEKGREMQVYKSAHDGLIICGDQESKQHLKQLLNRLIGGTMAAIIVAGISHVFFTRLLDIHLSLSTLELASSQTTQIHWWEFPSVWVLFVILLITLGSTAWKHHRERPNG